MNYNQFVDEVKTLFDEGRTLFGKNEIHCDPAFRKWRHRLTASINAIEDQGYPIKCDVRSRYFDILGYSDFSKRDRIDRYNGELQDTLNELETILEHFKKYGDPKATSASIRPQQNDKELEWPQKMTLSWLWRHAPVSLWVGVGGLLVTVFLLGVAAGQSQLFAHVQALWKPAQAVDTTAPNKALKPTP